MEKLSTGFGRKEKEVFDLKKLIKFHPDRISREMIGETPEMRVALMCLEPGQELAPHKPLCSF